MDYDEFYALYKIIHEWERNAGGSFVDKPGSAQFERIWREYSKHKIPNAHGFILWHARRGNQPGDDTSIGVRNGAAEALEDRGLFPKKD